MIVRCGGSTFPRLSRPARRIRLVGSAETSGWSEERTDIGGHFWIESPVRYGNRHAELRVRSSVNVCISKRNRFAGVGLDVVKVGPVGLGLPVQETDVRIVAGFGKL